MKPEIKTTSEIEKRANEIKGKLWADYEEKEWVALDDLKELLNKFWNDVWDNEVFINGIKIEDNSFIRTKKLSELYWKLYKKELGLK